MTQSPTQNPMPEQDKPEIKTAPLTDAEKTAKAEAEKKAGSGFKS
jgi:hypothetical protein